MISRTAEYALRALLFLARRGDAGPASAEVVAAALELPTNYLSKTLHQLARAGFLTSARGPGGGYALARSSRDIRVAELIGLFEERSTSGQCLLGGRRCDATHPCIAHERWSSVRADALRPFDTTLAQLLGGATSAPAGLTT